MSDMKPKRPARETAPRDIAPREEAGTDVPIVAQPPVPAAKAPPVAVPKPTPPAVPALPIALPEPAAPKSAAPPPVAASEPAAEIAAASPSGAPPKPAAAPTDDAWIFFAEAQAAFAHGIEDIAAEMSGITRSGMTAAADAAVALLGARTLAEAVEINARLARRGVDAMIEGSAKLSEIGMTAMTEVSRPILSRLGGTWSGAGTGR